MSKRAEKNTKIEGYNTIVCPNPQCKADQGTLRSKFASVIAECSECGRPMRIEIVPAYVTAALPAPRLSRVIMPANAYPGDSKIGTNDIDPEPPPAVREQMAANRRAAKPVAAQEPEPEDAVVKLRRERAEQGL